MTKGKVLVTGAAGFIGRNLSMALIRLGYEVHGLDNMSTGTYKNIVGVPFTSFIFGNHSALKGEQLFDYVIHLGAVSSTSTKDFDDVLTQNIQETIQLEKATLSKQRKSFIYASSAACYGNSNCFKEPDNLSEIMLERPHNLYGFSKWHIDRHFMSLGFDTDFTMGPPRDVVRAHTQAYRRKIIGLRYFNVFGPYEYHKGNMKSFALKTLIQTHVSNRPIHYCVYKSDGRKLARDFVYIDDAVSMTIAIMEQDVSGGIYNIGTGKAHFWWDVAEEAARAFETEMTAYTVRQQPMGEDVERSYQFYTQADMSKTRGVINVKCMTLQEAMRKYATFVSDPEHLQYHVRG